ncbi:MAG: tricarboxylate transporter, partial [Gammaproteobacteria bacterium]|nr:tricarboxylate transporter [Gammaproteobacteria bacterium]
MRNQLNMRRRRRLGLLLCTALFASVFSALPASAEVSFRGERIVWIVPSREGGGSDNFTRALAPMLAKHLPGKPTVVIRNIPGSGTIPGTNQFVEQAKGDGLMIITNSTSASMNQALNNEAVRYDLTKMKMVVAVPQGSFAYANPSTGAKQPEDIKMLLSSGKTYRFGGYGPTSSELRLLVSWELLGFDIKPLWGLSRGKVRQAFMRGETELNYDTASSWLKKVMPLVKNGEATPLFSLGIQDENDKFMRDPVTPELPHFNEVYEQVHGKPMSGPQRETWMALFNIGVMASKSVALPGDASLEVYEAYQKAVRDMIADPEWAKVQEEQLGPYPVFIGTWLEIREKFGDDADVVEALDRLMSQTSRF